jgi:hypothetical protein
LRINVQFFYFFYFLKLNFFKTFFQNFNQLIFSSVLSLIFTPISTSYTLKKFMWFFFLLNTIRMLSALADIVSKSILWSDIYKFSNIPYITAEKAFYVLNFFSLFHQCTLYHVALQTSKHDLDPCVCVCICRKHNVNI